MGKQHSFLQEVAFNLICQFLAARLDELVSFKSSLRLISICKYRNLHIKRINKLPCANSLLLRFVFISSTSISEIDLPHLKGSSTTSTRVQLREQHSFLQEVAFNLIC